MSRKVYASLLALVIALTVIVFAGRQSLETTLAAPASHDLLSALPASDFIIYVDAQRIKTDIIPSILADHPEDRAELNANLDRFMKETGLDPRLVDEVAVGLNLDSSTKASHFTVITRGRFDAGAAIEAGFAAAIKRKKGYVERRTEQYEGRTIYVLGPSARSRASQGPTNPPEPSSSKPTSDPVLVEGDQRKVIRVVSRGRMEQIAAVALDSNTVAAGTVESVRATIDASMGRGRVADELVQLATRTPSAVVSFSGHLTPALTGKLRLGRIGADTSVNSICTVYGSFNTSGNIAEALINIRTETPDAARQLSMALNAVKFVAGFGAAAKTTRETRSVAALLKDLNIYAVDNEVQVTLKVAHTDLAGLVNRF